MIRFRDIVIIIIIFMCGLTGASEKPISISGQRTTNYILDTNNRYETIQVMKSVEPNSDILPGSILCVSVEIKNLGQRPEDVYVIEYFDKDLEIVNYTHCYILSTLSDLIEYKQGLYDNLSKIEIEKKSDNGLFLFIDKLNPKDRIVYKYYVNPKKSGFYETGTILSFNNNQYPDLDYSLAIEIINPTIEFAVNLAANDFDVRTHSTVNLIYEITYLGEYPNYLCNITLDPTYGCHVTGPTEFRDVFFEIGKTMIINVSLYFPGAGLYRIPGISIGNNHYSFSSDEILVESLREILVKSIRLNTELLSLMVGILGICLSLFIYYESKTQSRGLNDTTRSSTIESDEERDDEIRLDQPAVPPKVQPTDPREDQNR